MPSPPDSSFLSCEVAIFLLELSVLCLNQLSRTMPGLPPGLEVTRGMRGLKLIIYNVWVLAISILVAH